MPLTSTIVKAAPPTATRSSDRRSLLVGGVTRLALVRVPGEDGREVSETETAPTLPCVGRTLDDAAEADATLASAAR